MAHSAPTDSGAERRPLRGGSVNTWRTIFRTRLLMSAALLWFAACADSNGSAAVAGSALADRYPCDRGIAGDPAVVWAENFEEGSVSAVASRYDSHNNDAGMALVADRPAASCGAAAMQFTAGGAASATDLYKLLLPGHEEYFVRWYVKYEAGAPWHHTGVWFGGDVNNNPYPFPHAGERPNGNDRVSFAMEPVWGIGGPNPPLDLYHYLMNMHTCSRCGGGAWGVLPPVSIFRILGGKCFPAGAGGDSTGGRRG